MKALLLCLLVFGLARPLLAVTYYASPSLCQFPKDGGINPANRYVAANDPVTTGQTVLDLGAVGTGGGVINFTPSRSTPGMVIVGENASASVVSSGFSKLAWYYCGPVVGSQVTTPWGKWANGIMVDYNGVPVDPTSGQVLPGQDARINIPLVNPFSDRGFTYDIQIMQNGQVVGDTMIELGPGETRNIGLSDDQPFSANVYPVIEGQISGSGTGYASTGGSSGGSGGSGGTSVDPHITGGGGGTGGKTGTTTQPTQTATGTTEVETQNAINRLSTITMNLGESNKQQNTAIIAELNGLGIKASNQLAATKAETATLDGDLDSLKGSVDAVKDAIDDQGPNGGTGLTQTQVKDAVKDGVTQAYGGTAGTHAADTTGMEDVLNNVAGATGIGTAGRIFGKLGDSLGHLSGMAEGLGLSGTYGAESWDFSAYLGSYIGSKSFSFSSYAWFFTIVRTVELWILSLFFMKQYFQIVRGALVG